MYLGLNKDITQARIFAIYVDPEDECNYVVTTYPGQAIEFSEEHYDENNCLNIHSWFGTVWDKQIQISERSSVNIQTSGPDPFQVFGSTNDSANDWCEDESEPSTSTDSGVIQLTTPIFTGSRQRANGLFGVHFKEDLFQKLITPLTTANIWTEDGQMVEGVSDISFWVFSQAQLKHRSVWDNKPLFKAPKCDEIEMNQDLFRNLVSTLYTPQMQNVTVGDNIQYKAYSQSVPDMTTISQEERMKTFVRISDDTLVGQRPWKDIKRVAMTEDYYHDQWYIDLNKEELEIFYLLKDS